MEFVLRGQLAQLAQIQYFCAQLLLDTMVLQIFLQNAPLVLLLLMDQLHFLNALLWLGTIACQGAFCSAMQAFIVLVDPLLKYLVLPAQHLQLDLLHCHNALLWLGTMALQGAFHSAVQAFIVLLDQLYNILVLQVQPLLLDLLHCHNALLK